MYCRRSSDAALTALHSLTAAINELRAYAVATEASDIQSLIDTGASLRRTPTSAAVKRNCIQKCQGPHGNLCTEVCQPDPAVARAKREEPDCPHRAAETCKS